MQPQAMNSFRHGNARALRLKPSRVWNIRSSELLKIAAPNLNPDLLTFCLTWVFKFYLNHWAQHSHKSPFPSCCYLSFKRVLVHNFSCWSEILLHVHCLANQVVHKDSLLKQKKKQLRNDLLKVFRFFLLQPAKWPTRRARWPIVHLTVVKAACVTRFQGQQQMQPLNWLQALEPFCLFLPWICLLNPVSLNVFHLSLGVFVYLY